LSICFVLVERAVSIFLCMKLSGIYGEHVKITGLLAIYNIV